MSRTVQYSPAAIQDLDRVWDEVYEASKSGETASNYVYDLMDEIAKRKEFPESAPRLFYQDMDTGYRYIPFKSYIAFYFIDGEAIKVSRVLYGRSDYMRKLF